MLDFFRRCNVLIDPYVEEIFHLVLGFALLFSAAAFAVVLISGAIVFVAFAAGKLRVLFRDCLGDWDSGKGCK